MKTDVLLWSGGLDSLLVAILTPWTGDQALFVTVDADGMSEGELEAIARAVPELAALHGRPIDHVVLKAPASASTWSRHEDVFSYQRNLLCLTLAAREAMFRYPSTTELTLRMGQAADDDVSDNHGRFRLDALHALQWGVPATTLVKVSAPLSAMLKHEAMIAAWEACPEAHRPRLLGLLSGSVSCYKSASVDVSEGLFGCGDCASCFRAWLALTAFEQECGVELGTNLRYRVRVPESDTARQYLRRAQRADADRNALPARKQRDALILKLVR